MFFPTKAPISTFETWRPSLFATAFFLLASTGVGQSAQAEEHSDQVKEPEEKARLKTAQQACPRLFGSKKSSEKNRTQRERELFTVETSPRRVQLLVGVPRWLEPNRGTISGLQFSSQNGRMTVQVNETLADFCEAGTYVLKIDDAMGQEVRVLAQTPEGVLIERQTAKGSKLQTLAYVNQKRRPRPKYQVMWRSNFQLIASTTSSSSSSRTSSGKPSSLMPTSSSMNSDAEKDPVARAKARAAKAKERRDRRKKERDKRREEANKLVESLPTTKLMREMKAKERNR
ncbi:MAG: hypothetical protein GY822_04580 [Deltaproteobacteria bacterium]|nr:hypothetical protein [Deltaproteobacteria bacterium]